MLLHCPLHAHLEILSAGMDLLSRLAGEESLETPLDLAIQTNTLQYETIKSNN